LFKIGPAGPEYERSIFYYLRDPIRFSLDIFPLMVLIDASAIILSIFGFSGAALYPEIAESVLGVLEAGFFVTRLKDWIVQQIRRPLAVVRKQRDAQRRLKERRRLDGEGEDGAASLEQVEVAVAYRDEVREKTLDEISSVCIWFVTVFLCVELSTIKLGFSLKSILALGGLGSASLVLAFKGTAEAFLSGIILKLQDRFRPGEYVQIGGGRSKAVDGIVKGIKYLNTVLTQPDGSELEVPNVDIIQGNLVNWSRTRERFFETRLQVDWKIADELPCIIEDLREEVRP
jgi:small-conductance mechanosensitive channel